MNSTELHDDHFLKILWDEQSRIIGIDWKETTAAMSDDDMKHELILFAGYVEEKRAPRILVDVTKFHFRLSPAMQEWRVKNISSRYNAAGVKRFAFVFPGRRPDPSDYESSRRRRRLHDPRLQQSRRRRALARRQLKSSDEGDLRGLKGEGI